MLPPISMEKDCPNPSPSTFDDQMVGGGRRILGEDILGRSIGNTAVRIHVARSAMFIDAARKLVNSQSASLCQRSKGIVCFNVQVVWVWVWVTVVVIWRAKFRSKKSGRRDSQWTATIIKKKR
jgi:hypothetical protein